MPNVSRYQVTVYFYVDQKYKLQMKYKYLKAFLSQQYLHFFSVEPQQPSVELAAVSESNMNFTWNEYQHCNSDSVLVMYEFELRRNDNNAIVHSGKESNTKISFNNLESTMEYVFRVRVSITDYLTGSNYFSSWGSPGMDHFESID